jgi:hypothetical protein
MPAMDWFSNHGGVAGWIALGIKVCEIAFKKI